ncbi:sigma-70 family RNA polymerase sigma factor [Pseudomonadota bacterium]|nr:sigma-70 family RNA polymerase sigma factor [Pseudomonadota bacterium]
MGDLTGDEMLVNDIKAGNALAFEAMVIKYQPKLLSSLIAYTKSHEQAEELCQKTFIRVWQKIDTFRGDSALFTWIYRIGINLAKNDFASSYAKSKKKTDPLDVSEHDVSSHISPEVELIGKEAEQTIFNFIETLEMDIKTAFTLRELEGRSYEEIASIMKCPIGTVRSRIFRARQLIVEFMNQEDILND